MNKDRRKTIEEIKARIEALSIEDIVTDIESVRDEEQEYFEAMPESLQGGEKGSKAEEAIAALEEAIESLNEIIENLSAAANSLDTASE
jgi:archaellum component FlaC